MERKSKEECWYDYLESKPPSEDFIIGWLSCKEEVLKILKSPILNLDLSIDFVDDRIVELVKKL